MKSVQCSKLFILCCLNKMLFKLKKNCGRYRTVGQKSWHKPNRELVYRYSPRKHVMNANSANSTNVSVQFSIQSSGPASVDVHVFDIQARLCASYSSCSAITYHCVCQCLYSKYNAFGSPYVLFISLSLSPSLPLSPFLPLTRRWWEAWWIWSRAAGVNQSGRTLTIRGRKSCSSLSGGNRMTVPRLTASWMHTHMHGVLGVVLS